MRPDSHSSSSNDRSRVDRSRPTPPGVSAWSLVVGAVAFATYLWLTPPVAGDGDSSELTLALALNGVPHPTGYPIYAMLGHLFVATLHHLGCSWAYAAGAWSALGGGVAMTFMHALGARLIPSDSGLAYRDRQLLALVPVLVFIFNPLWTDVATLAEVYSWHQAWVLAITFVFVGAMRAAGQDPLARSPEGEPPHRPYALAATWGLLCGLGLSHHLTSILTSGPLSLALCVTLMRARAASVTMFVVAVVCAIVPISSYATLVAKAGHPGPAVWFRLEPTWPSVLAHAMGHQYHGLVGHFRPSASQTRILARDVYPVLVPAAGVLVLAASRARERIQATVLWTLVATVALQLVFCFTYGVVDLTTYFLPPLALALVAFSPVMAWVMTAWPRARRVAAWAACVVALLAVAQYGRWLGVAVGRRDVLVRLDDGVRRIWRSIPIDHGVVLWGGDFFHRCNAYQALAGERRGLRLISPYELVAPLAPARFEARFGFAPLEASGALAKFERPPSERGPGYEAFLDAEARRLHALTGEPVAILSPATDSVRVVAATAR